MYTYTSEKYVCICLWLGDSNVKRKEVVFSNHKRFSLSLIFFSFKYVRIYINKPMSVKRKCTVVEYEKRAEKRNWLIGDDTLFGCVNEMRDI
jgi:hypothetical protein